MFIWTSGMSPMVTLLIFIAGTILLVYSMAGAFRWTFGWGEDARGRSGQWHCADPQCRAVNRPHGNYCRMCGRRRNA